MVPTRKSIALVLTAGCAVMGPAASAQDAEYRGAQGNQVINLAATTTADSFPGLELSWGSPAFSEEGGNQNSVVCLVTARRDGAKVAPSGVTLGGDILNLETAAVLVSLPEKTRPFNPDARFSWELPDFSADFADDDRLSLGVFVAGGLEGEQEVDLVQVQCKTQSRAPCTAGGGIGCLLSGARFKVSVTSGGVSANVASTDFNSAEFSLGGAHRVTVQVLNGCSQNDHFWVAIDPETELELAVIIEDTQTGHVVSFANPGSAATDIAAFATCP